MQRFSGLLWAVVTYKNQTIHRVLLQEEVLVTRLLLDQNLLDITSKL